MQFFPFFLQFTFQLQVPSITHLQARDGSQRATLCTHGCACHRDGLWDVKDCHGRLQANIRTETNKVVRKAGSVSHSGVTSGRGHLLARKGNVTRRTGEEGATSVSLRRLVPTLPRPPASKEPTGNKEREGKGWCHYSVLNRYCHLQARETKGTCPLCFP